MNIIVIGASGLVGYAVCQRILKRRHKLTAYCNARDIELPGAESIQKLDLSDPESIVQPLLEAFPDAIINCAAISNPAGVLANPELSYKLNVGLPERLSQIACHLSAKFIHLSTDMVFNGNRGNYKSTDEPFPVNAYGEQKLEAEKRVLKEGDYFASVIRIPIQLGNSPSESRSVHEKLFAAWAEGKAPKLFTDEIRQPCTAESTASVIVELCERNDLHGLFHWAGSEKISRYEMGKRILQHFGLPEDMIEPCEASKLDDGEPRPLNLTFNLHPLEGKVKTKPQSFDDQLEDLVVPLKYRKWYHSV